MNRNTFMNIDNEVMESAMQLTGCKSRQELWNLTKLAFGGNARTTQTNRIDKEKRRNGKTVTIMENGRATNIGALHQLLA